MIRFETDRTIVEDLKEADFPDLLRIYNKKENMKFISSGKYEWSEEEIKEKFGSQMENYSSGYGIFGIKLKSTMRLVGEAGLFDSFNNQEILELGYIIDKSYWKKGYGTEVCNGLINYGFERLSLRKVKARMYSSNRGSIKLSEKCGMSLVNSGTEKGIDYLEYELENLKTTHNSISYEKQ